MSVALNNVTTKDGYVSANELYCPNAVKVNIYVNNNPIYYQYERADSGTAPGSGVWNPEVFLLPGAFNLIRRTNNIRVRSAVAGSPAQVTIECLTPFD